MMTKLFYLPSFCLALCFLLLSSLPLSTVHAEVVYHSAPPAKKISKKKKQHYKKQILAQKRWHKKKKRQPDNIVFGLYVTFALLILLPILVLLGTLLVALGFPGLVTYILGATLIGVGNLGVILAGVFTGATKTYNTQVLYLAVWVLFGLNLAALIIFVLLYSVVFVGAPLLLFLAIGVGVVALIFLIWGAIITRSKRRFKAKSYLNEE